MAQMNLYFIVATDDNGDNQDWFVVAGTPEAALELWKNRTGEPDEDDIRPVVFLVPATPHATEPTILGWHAEVEAVL